MSDLAGEVSTLLKKAEQTRTDFLLAEVQTCAIALDMARLEFQRGNVEFAAREVESATKGIAVIERFLPEARKDQQPDLRNKLISLKAVLESVQRDFQGKPA